MNSWVYRRQSKTMAPRYHIVPLEELVSDLKTKTGSDFRDVAETLVKRIAPLGFKLAINRLGDRPRAEDALQDTFEIVFEKLSQLRNPSAFKAWFCRILLHCCQKQDSTEIPSETIERTATTNSSPIEKLGLAQLLRLLPSNDRNVLILREVMEMSYEELADTLRIPIGTVRSRLSKARQRANEIIKEQGYE